MLLCCSETGVIKDAVVLLKQTSPLTHITGRGRREADPGRASRAQRARAAAASGHLPPLLNHRLMNIGRGQLTGAHMCIVTKMQGNLKKTQS